ncbi:hypothetical protein [Stenotrophomonas sp. S39]|uniref:hypothetical protein n=1 Tax=Stenotrophomonas sp. S39 TaxID=2767451 RepID=UPI002D7E3B74|nr:hypothetical protein [Stenotrophomonas sp. S39]
MTRHLDTWWSSAGGRRQRRAIEAGRPELPSAVNALAQRDAAAGEQAEQRVTQRTHRANQECQPKGFGVLREYVKEQLPTLAELRRVRTVDPKFWSL